MVWLYIYIIREYIMHPHVRKEFSMEGQTIRIGVDVGGTNTDICAIDEI